MTLVRREVGGDLRRGRRIEGGDLMEDSGFEGLGGGREEEE